MESNLTRQTVASAARRRVSIVRLFALAFLPAACGGAGAQFAAEPNPAYAALEQKVFPLSCDDGRRYAARALIARSFKLTGAERTANGGTVSGVNESERTSATIEVDCGGAGVRITPKAGPALVVQMLRASFDQLVDLEDKVYPPPTSPVLKLHLVGGVEETIEFSGPLRPLGVVAVRVSLWNAGQRILRLDPGRIFAVSARGKTRAIGAAEVERRLASDPEIHSKVLRGGKVKPGERLAGFAFFPTGEYRNASVELVDEATGEADDFAVNLAGGPS